MDGWQPTPAAILITWSAKASEFVLRYNARMKRVGLLKWLSFLLAAALALLGCALFERTPPPVVALSPTSALSTRSVPGTPPTLTPTPTETLTPTLTDTPLPTHTPTPTQTFTPTLTWTPTATFTPGPPPGACLPDDAPQQTAFVQWVNDGDTIVVLLDGQYLTVQYLGILAPLDNPPASLSTPVMEFRGPEATARNAALVSGQVVRLVQDGIDKDESGRLLRYVFVGDLFINYELVRTGLAQTDPLAPLIACAQTLSAAEENARLEGVGMWEQGVLSTLYPTPVIALWLTPTVTPPKWPPKVKPPWEDLLGSVTPGVCSCAGDIYNCGDFSPPSSAQACFDYCKSLGKGDIHKLDGDNDDRACE